MTRNEADRFLAAVEEIFSFGMYVFFTLAIWCGLRRGELLALKWGDINLGASEDSVGRYIMVQRTWSAGQMGTPKSDKSRRVDISRQTRRVLVQLRDERLMAAFLAGKNSIADDLVFPGQNGEPLVAETIGIRFMDPALAKAGLRKFTVHDLRHTYASILIQNGVPLKYVSEQMGHSSIKVTADMYGHLEPGANVYLIDRVEAATNANQAQTPEARETTESMEATAITKVTCPPVVDYYVTITNGIHPTC